MSQGRFSPSRWIFSWPRVLLVGLGIVCLCCFAGCASVDDGEGGYTAITAASTPLYGGYRGSVTGAPDDILPAGTRVRIVDRSGEMVRVQTTTGQSGFVSRYDLVAAP